MKKITKTSQSIRIKGYAGKWYCIDSIRKCGKSYFLMESENYGDDAACIILTENGNVAKHDGYKLDEVYNGFDDMYA